MSVCVHSTAQTWWSHYRAPQGFFPQNPLNARHGTTPHWLTLPWRSGSSLTAHIPVTETDEKNVPLRRVLVPLSFCHSLSPSLFFLSLMFFLSSLVTVVSLDLPITNQSPFDGRELHRSELSHAWPTCGYFSQLLGHNATSLVGRQQCQKRERCFVSTAHQATMLRVTKTF